MKKWLLVVITLAVVVSAFGCGQAKPIPTAAIDEVRALNDAGATSEYVEIQDASDRKDYFYIMFYIKSLPGEFTSLEDAIPLAEQYTLLVAKAAVDILDSYDINKDIAVWAQLPLEEGGVKVLGHAEYDGKNYIEFELH